MSNHGVSSARKYTASSTVSSEPQVSAPAYFQQKRPDLPEIPASGLARLDKTGHKPDSQGLPLSLLLSGWQQFKNSSFYLPAAYLLMVNALTLLGLAIYSQFIQLTVVNLQITGQIIFIGLWAAIVGAVVMALNSLKKWHVQQRYVLLKPLALQIWEQLDELNIYIGRVQKICQTTEKPAAPSLMKYLDNYYEKSVSLNKTLQKIKLFLDNSQFDQLLSQYNATSSEFRDKLTELIALLSDQPAAQAPCQPVLQALTPICLAVDQHHQTIARQVGRIIRY